MTSAPVVGLSSAARQLVRWGAAEGRALPWRYSGDRYKLAVAEVLLQKTKADAVVSVWESLITHYPTAATLASAKENDLWRFVSPLGLGKQRVARLLAVANALDGQSQLRGVGNYGSAMLALEAGQEPEEPPVDGNIARVLSRVIGATWDRGEPRKKKQIRDASGAWLSALKGRRVRLQVAYALVDLGALVCTPRKPRCGYCPISKQCISPQQSAIGKVMS